MTVRTVPPIAEAQELGLDPHRLARIREAVSRDVAGLRYDGMAIRVLKDGQPVLAEDIGYAERASDRALTPDTVFLTMSLGKQFVNAVVLSYVERGLLDLTLPVAEVLPGFGCRGKDRITLFHLLTHTGGVFSGVPPLPPGELASNAAVAAFAAGARLESLPGERVNYSMVCAHAVLGEMLRAADGGRRTFTELMSGELFDLLGMTETSVGVREDLASRLAPMAARYTEAGVFGPADVEGVGALIGIPGSEMAAGGYVTTASDLTRFVLMLRNGGEFGGFRLLSPAMIKLAAQNHTGRLRNTLFDFTLDGRHWSEFPAHIGLGFFVRGSGVAPGPFGNLCSPDTFGGAGAGTSCFWVDPQHDTAFIMLTTGAMEDTRHYERSRRISDMVISSITG
ncbi:serine hydrolase domain-containing protein [Actinomadura vinacea]|uniref:Serine hydrolase domain-containing protein n=1 Tax=Actinomadura vinacea TaxID=115336 RepID=A0ABP5WE70_9ACTN